MKIICSHSKANEAGLEPYIEPKKKDPIDKTIIIYQSNNLQANPSTNTLGQRPMIDSMLKQLELFILECTEEIVQNNKFQKEQLSLRQKIAQQDQLAHKINVNKLFEDKAKRHETLVKDLKQEIIDQHVLFEKAKTSLNTINQENKVKEQELHKLNMRIAQLELNIRNAQM